MQQKFHPSNSLAVQKMKLPRPWWCCCWWRPTHGSWWGESREGVGVFCTSWPRVEDPYFRCYGVMLTQINPISGPPIHHCPSYIKSSDGHQVLIFDLVHPTERQAWYYHPSPAIFEIWAYTQDFNLGPVYSEKNPSVSYWYRYIPKIVQTMLILQLGPLNRRNLFQCDLSLPLWKQLQNLHWIPFAKLEGQSPTWWRLYVASAPFNL